MIEVIHQRLDVSELNRLQGVLTLPGIVYPLLQGSAALLIMLQLSLLLLQVPHSEGKGSGRNERPFLEPLPTMVNGQDGNTTTGNEVTSTRRGYPAIPAVYLRLDAAPAVSQLTHQV